jgi:hypothetical protein
VTLDSFRSYRGHPQGRWLFRSERLRLRSDRRGSLTVGEAFRVDPWLRDWWSITDDLLVLSAWFEGVRGTAKTTNAAAIGVERLCLRGEHDIFVLALDSDQARTLKREADGFVDRDSVLSRVLEKTRDGIKNPANGSELRVLPADSEGNYGHGARPYTAVIDEFWNQPSRALYDAFASALPKTHGSQVLILTNSGSVGSPAWEVREMHRTSADPALRFFAPHLEGHFPSWLDRTEVARQRRILPAREFARLWEGSWLAGSDLAFRWADIAACLIDEDFDAAA